jgi:hypothetical protein
MLPSWLHRIGDADLDECHGVVRIEHDRALEGGDRGVEIGHGIGCQASDAIDQVVSPTAQCANASSGSRPRAEFAKRRDSPRAAADCMPSNCAASARRTRSCA